MPHHFLLHLNTSRGSNVSISITQNVSEGLPRCPSSLIWVTIYSKTAYHGVVSQAVGGARLYFKRFPANTYNSLAVAAWQVANNYSVTKVTKLFPYCTKKKNDQTACSLQVFSCLFVYAWAAIRRVF